MQSDNVRGNRVKAQPANEVESDKPFIGVVTDCVKLNVRETPDPNGRILTVITALSTVTVDLEASTDTFCKVRTEGNVEGYCMKQYIHLRR